MLTLSSSSSSSIFPWKYHIFLSFSGKETRKSFTDHLYVALNQNGIITFRDDNNLRRGEDIASELLKAIGESWGSIIVFSEGYPFSSWCLDELAGIMKQRKERGHRVYPIFYHVEVCHLRHQSERVKEAFDRHEKRGKDNKEKTQRWRDALFQVANISGWTLKDQYESDFIQVIVKEISAGVAADVGEVSRNKRLFSFQKQLLSPILHEENVIFNEGNDIISQRLPHKKMDDVYKLTILDARRNELEAMNFFHRKIDESSVANLVKKMNRTRQRINTLKDDTESRISAELQHPREEVQSGLELVDRLCDFIQDLQQNYGESSIAPRGFLQEGKFKKTQGFLEEIIFEKMRDVNKLLQLREFQGSLFQDRPVVGELRWIEQVLFATNLVGDAAKICVEKIWAYLMDDGVSKIGVCGMGGVGKTTIMKLITDKLLEETEKFNIVIWITVSREMNIFRLQNSIAKAMQVSLPAVEDEVIRAGFICEMLSRKGKYVLILDDLWDKLSLESVGIPEPSKGSKLVVTTRSLVVCEYLGCLPIQMPTLSKSDAWRLFLEKVGRDVLNNPELLPIVRSVAEACDGLPLDIVVIATFMKCVRNILEWRNAFHELNGHVGSVNRMEGTVFQQLQFTYDRLDNEKLKHCFLCCALYPADFEIFADDLINLWVAEGLVEEMDSNQLEFDKGHAILNKLKNSCLIENGTENPGDAVKLHDIARDMALRIMSARSEFLVRAGLRLKEIPKEQEWKEELEKVSLMWNLGMQIPSQMPSPRCQKLTTLLLSYCDMKSIPECFFEQMHGLKILGLSGNHIKSLPNSISNLENLTTLLLDGCEDLEKVPSFSKLQSLKKLDLRNTKIKDLPHGLERLVNLKYFDFSGTSITEVADGILPNFTSLQHLAILNFDEAVDRFARGGEVNRFVRGEEIGGLRKLEYFEGGFYDLNEWNNYIKALHAPTEGPRQYYIFVGVAPFFSFPSESKKVIQLSSRNICIDGIKVLPDVEGLGIGECIVDLCEEEAFSSRFILPPHNVFSSLSDLYISDCKNIKKLFSSNWVLQNLQNLKCLLVSDCGDMEEIISAESESEEEGRSAINFTLPKLRRLEFERLPELKSISSANGVMVCDSIEEITITWCPKLKRIPLYLPLHDDGQPSPPPSLRRISIFPLLQWQLVEWDQPNAKFLLEPYLK